jgi:hypothetical protein
MIEAFSLSRVKYVVIVASALPLPLPKSLAPGLRLPARPHIQGRAAARDVFVRRTSPSKHTLYTEVSDDDFGIQVRVGKQ